MSKNYDNWEKLVVAVLRRDQLRRIALCDSIDTSIFSSASSSINLGSASPLPSYEDQTTHLDKPDWETDPAELDFSASIIIGKGSFGEILKASWRGTPVAIKRIIPKLSDDRLVIRSFRHEVDVLMKLRHPNIVEFLGAVTEKKPLMLITEYLRGGDLHQFLKEKGALSPGIVINFALDIARGMAYLHSEPNVVIHRDLQPRNVFLVNTSANHLKVGDFGLSKHIRLGVLVDDQYFFSLNVISKDRYMAPEVSKHRKYDKKVDVFSFAMILYEMLEGEPPMLHYEPYEAARYVAEGHRPIFRSKGSIPELREHEPKTFFHGNFEEAGENQGNAAI